MNNPRSKLKLVGQYIFQKVKFSSIFTLQKYYEGQIAASDVWPITARNIFTGEMTYLFRNKGSEMEPTISPNDALLVRHLFYLNESTVPGYKQVGHEINVGDVVLLKDPMNSNNYIVRRLAAVEGYEIVSTDKDDEPFVIERDQGWVLSDNKNLKPKEYNDSRAFGPISMSDIKGRVMYRYRTNGEHHKVKNSELSMSYDGPALYMEGELEKLRRFAEKGKQAGSS